MDVDEDMVWVVSVPGKLSGKFMVPRGERTALDDLLRPLNLIKQVLCVWIMREIGLHLGRLA